MNDNKKIIRDIKQSIGKKIKVRYVDGIYKIIGYNFNKLHELVIILYRIDFIAYMQVNMFDYQKFKIIDKKERSNGLQGILKTVRITYEIPAASFFKKYTRDYLYYVP